MSRLAIVSALHAELEALLPVLGPSRRVSRAGREFHLGRLEGREVVLACTGVGKVAAASTASLMAMMFNVDAMLFTGVAGGLAPGVAVGDVVVAGSLLQHDLDASPLFPRYEVPLTGRSRFDTDKGLSDALAAAVPAALSRLAGPLVDFGVSGARLHRGLVVSGDRFVSTAGESEALRTALPEALAVEMEGAAVAQVCHDFGLPCAVLRTISDRADDQAHVDFNRFLQHIASSLSREVVCAALRALPH
jgi:adenosylhomocysteine nucleosidase